MRIFKVVSMLFVLWALAFPGNAQNRRMLLVPLTQAWKLEAKSGAGIMLSEVPDNYLWILNDVNIPVQAPGLYTTLSLRKMITRRFEAGYMVSFSDYSGDVQQVRHKYLAHTMGLEHSVQFLYNFRPTDNIRQRFNCFTWYKFGLVSLKNDVSLYLNSGRLYRNPEMEADDFFTSYAVIGTGVGLGISYRFAPDLNLVGAYEYNRSTDDMTDVYKIHKIFYDSPNTVNHYSSVSLGLSYTFDLVEARKKNIDNFKRRSELGKRLKHARVRYKNRHLIRKG